VSHRGGSGGGRGGGSGGIVGSSGGGGGRDSGSGGSIASGGIVSGGGTGGVSTTGLDGGPDVVTVQDASRDGGSPPGGIVTAGVRWFGRIDVTNPQMPRFSWSGTGFVARFSGTSLAVRLGNTGVFRFKSVVDGVPQPPFTTTVGVGTYDLATGLAAGTHTVELYRQTEGAQGESQLQSLVATGGALLEPPAPSGRMIEVIGDSISCGFGTLGTLADTDCFATESHWDSYAAIAARSVNAEVSTIATSGRGIYRNYGGDMSDTMPSVYGRALANAAAPTWDFRIQPRAVVINLGTNDISNNKGDPGMPFRNGYLALVGSIRMRYPNALIICLIGPLLSGADLTAIQAHIRSVVATRNAAGDSNIEFFDQVMPQTADKFACSYHPNVSEQTLMGAQLAAELRAKLGW
jgi:lysophospholipase L1-like esterase